MSYIPSSMNRLNLLDTTKQGLQSVDTRQVNRKIQDLTYGSAKFEMIQQRTCQQIKKAESLAAAAAALDPQEILHQEQSVDRVLSQRFDALFQKLPRIICVTDFDCFFCAVEALDRPELTLKPFVVAGGSIVSASNYEARKYGIRSAMPVKVCKELCSQLIVVQSNGQKYARVSKDAGKVFVKYDPNYSMLSIDEAELDITAAVMKEARHTAVVPETNFIGNVPPQQLEKAAAVVVDRIRTDIKNTFGLTVSCGVSICTQLAKLCADMKKPNGQSITPLSFSSSPQMQQGLVEILRSLPIRKIWGIGSATQTLLQNAFRIEAIGQIYEKRGVLTKLMGQTALGLVQAACGLQTILETFSATDEAKTIGNEKTFPETSDMSVLSGITLELCKKVCTRLLEADKVASRVRVKVRFADWSDCCHVRDIQPSQELDIIYQACQKIMQTLIEEKRRRSGGKLIQVGFGNQKNDCLASAVRLIGVVALGWEEEEQVQENPLEDVCKQKLIIPERLKKTQGQGNAVLEAPTELDSPMSTASRAVTPADGNRCPLCGQLFSSQYYAGLHAGTCAQNRAFQEQRAREAAKKVKAGPLDAFLARQRGK